MTELKQSLIQLWQSACIDKPLRESCQVINGDFVLSITGNRAAWVELISASGIPTTATQEINGGSITVRWASHADSIFAAGGALSEHLPNYEPRIAQLHMGRMVQRSIEMREAAVIEAGTGTGKSFAYAAICLAMGLRCVISTSNKALQMQLYRKDIPFLTSTLYPGKKVELVQGKANYACRYKVEDYNAPGFVGIENSELRDWYTTTKTGNTEEIPFAVDWKELGAITADNGCLGKMCMFYDSCHYYGAKERRGDADVLITNHMLLAMHQMYPGAGILPDVDVVIVDEAHKLADYVRNATGVQLRLSAIDKAIAEAGTYEEKMPDDDFIDGAKYDAMRLSTVINRLINESKDRQIGIASSMEIMQGRDLFNILAVIADNIWYQGDMPSTPGELSDQRFADHLRTLADQIQQMSEKTRAGFVRYIDNDPDGITLNNTPYDVSDFIGELAGFRTAAQQSADHTRCVRCHRELTAATVAILDNKPYGPECIRKEDPYGDAVRVELAEWLQMEHKAETATPQADDMRTPIIFTSATLAAPDFDAFLRDCGIPYALQMRAESPFNYRDNALLYIPNGAPPKPNSDEWQPWMIAEIRRLVACAGGGAFLLFTSYANMQAALDSLRTVFTRDGLTVLVQGELPKLEIGKRFAADGNAVLFATKSFFEGVSIDGDALRLVVIDKLPFEAPNPLNQAQESALKDYARDVLKLRGNQAEWYPFNAFRVPRMIIEVKQGVGRLIRTATDAGVMAILDSRTRQTQYGAHLVLPSLPPAKLSGDIHEIGNWYQARRRAAMVAAVPKVDPPKRNDRLLGGGDRYTEDDDGMLWA